MKESIRELPRESLEVSVERLTLKQFRKRDLDNFCWVNPHIGIYFIALGRDEKGNVLKARVMKGIDEQEFLFGDEKYLDEVLTKAKELLTFEERKINISHANNFNSEYLERREKRRPGWKISFSGYHGYNTIIIWDGPKGLWLEERGRLGVGRRDRSILLRSCSLTGPMLKDVVEKTSEELAKLQ